MIEFSAPAVVPHDPRANATELLLDRVRATPEIPLFALPNSSGGWDDITARQFYDEVVALAKGFVAAGIKVGDRVGL
ncbi:MAG: AMP-binding protein, partial [Actinobacteria bacterium]|nr:AMP-binding protein [Actinomycetota bacterium]